MKDLIIPMTVYMRDKFLRSVVLMALLSVFLGVNARTYLVAVGIADYSGYPQEISNLILPAKDAQTIVDLYSKNTSVDYSVLLNEKATKDRILRAVKMVFDQASEEDIIVFFFSGHGYVGGFCAYDGNLSYEEVRKSMSQSKCNNKMMFVDACCSGGIRVDEKEVQGSICSAKNANVMLFLSSRNNENSLERRDMQNGYFTTYLQKGLKGNADSDRNRIITAKELFDFVHNGVSKISGNMQHPVMWGRFNDDMTVMQW